MRRLRALLADAPAGHAAVRRAHDAARAQGPQVGHQVGHDVGRHPFLHLQPAGVGLDEPEPGGVAGPLTLAHRALACRRPSMTKTRDLVALHHRRGRTVGEIVAKIGVARNTVYYHIRKLSLRPIRRSPLAGIDVPALVAQHGQAEVARMFGVSRQAVHQALRKGK
jgi:transposase-like protein